MIINKIELLNWGPHEKISWETDVPVLAIMGDNGSGKSHILEAIGFAFTGKLGKYGKDRKNRPSDTFIREHEGERAANGSVQVWFEKGGLKGRVFRQIGKSPKRELEWEGIEGGKILKSAKEVEELLEEILDCDKDAVELAVFLSQGEIGRFLFGNAAGREVDFARMCLIDHLEDVGDVSLQEIGRLSKMISDLTPLRDEAVRNRQDQLEALELAEQNLKAAPDKAGRLRLLQEQQEREQDLVRSKAQIPETEKELESVRSTLKDLPDRADDDRQATLLREQMSEAHSVELRVTEAKRQMVRRQQIAPRLQGIGDPQAKLAEIERQTGDKLKTQVEVSESLVAVETQSQILTTKIREVEAVRQRVTERNTIRERMTRGQELMTETEEKILALLKDDPEPLEADQPLKDQLTELNNSVRLIPLILQMSEHRECEGSSCVLCGSSDWKGFPSEPELENMRADLAEKNVKIGELEKTLHERAQARRDHERDLKEARELLGRCNIQMEALKKELEPFADVPEKAEDLTKLLEESEALQSKIKALQEKKSEITTTLSELRATRQSLDNAVEEKKRLEQELKDLPSESILQGQIVPVPDTEKLKEELKVVELRIGRRVSLEGSIQGLETKLIDLRKKAEEQQKRITEGRKTIEVLPEQNLTKLIEEVNEQQRQHNQCMGVVESATNAFRRAERRLLEVEEQMVGQEGVRDLIGQLEEIRQHFSRGGIPRAYLSQVFEQLVAGTQQLLSIWEEDFQVEQDEENLFNFKFFKTDDPETVMDQVQLSGGQKVRLSLAFCMAAQELMFPNLGFLCVDEPSTHLDPSGKEGLVRLFRNVAQQNEQTGSQVWVIDHAQELEPGFSKVFRLAHATDLPEAI